MNVTDTILDPNAIEEIVCKKMEKLTTVRMTNELSSILIQLMLVPKDKPFKIPQEEKPFLFQVIEKRIEICFTFKTQDDRLILFLAALSVTPGIAVMYLWYLQYWCSKNDVKEIDLDILCSRIFPNGFFKEEDLSEIWDEQKVKSEGSDNLLDYQTAGESIQFK